MIDSFDKYLLKNEFIKTKYFRRGLIHQTAFLDNARVSFDTGDNKFS
ncbi:MAG: hypothetical protein AABZ74_17860 [Cyanobacteriota bacterium]